jgi:ketol-acid reductoisomerase
MGDLTKLKTLFANFSKDVLAMIDSVHTQIADVNDRLSNIEKGHLQRDVTKELEREKEILATKLEITTRHAMEKVTMTSSRHRPTTLGHRQ